MDNTKSMQSFLLADCFYTQLSSVHTERPILLKAGGAEAMEITDSVMLINAPLFFMGLLLFSIVFYLYSWGSSGAVRRIPGSLGWPVIGESFSFLSEFSSPTGIYNFIHLRRLKYGKVFKTHIMGRAIVFVSGRDASRILLTGNGGVVSSNLFYSSRQVLGPNSLLQTNGEPHKRLRRLIGEPLSVDALKKYLRKMETVAVSTLDGWAGGGTVWVLDQASNFTFKVISYMIMSLEPGPEQDKLRKNFQQISSALATMPLKIPGTAFYRGIKARDRMYSALDSVISRRRNGEEFHDDFLQSLVTKELYEEDKLTDSHLKDNLLTILVAGHDTTTAALTWAIKYLEDNPHALHKLREEHREIQRKRIGDTNLTWTEVKNMSYTNKVISETLRMANILPWLSRRAMQDIKINGFEMKKGWAINLDVRAVHHDPELYGDPERFDPSRFDEQQKPFTFLGFGGGVRMCPGMNLARLEMCVFLHHFVCRYRWKSMEEDDSLQPKAIPMLKNRYPIVVEPLG